MDIERANRALEAVARKDGMTLDEVRKNIELGIKEAIDTAIAENNVAALNEWRKIPCAGSRPTAVELVAFLADSIVCDHSEDTTFLS